MWHGPGDHLWFGAAVCDSGDLALLYESWWKSRRSVIYTISPDNREAEKQVLFDRSVEVTGWRFRFTCME
jgi:hypothetical protein